MNCKVYFAVPGSINTESGGYRYDRKLISQLREIGVEIEILELGASFPHPSKDHLFAAQQKLISLPKEAVLLADGLLYGALETEIVRAIQARVVALVHHPLAEEPGLADALRARFFDLERENLALADAVVTTSEFTARVLEDRYDLERERISVVLPGRDFEPLESSAQTPQLILSVGIYVPRKGHDVLIHALSLLKHLHWQCVIVGSELDPDYSKILRQLVLELGLESRVELVGFISDERLRELYSKASVFALATRYEGYGMVFNEALAQGLPIVSTNAGAVPRTLGDAGLTVPSDSPEAFAAALKQVLQDSNLQAQLSSKALAKLASIPAWSDSAKHTAHLLTSLCQGDN